MLTTEMLVNLVPWVMVFAFAMMIYASWLRERREDRSTRRIELDLQHQRLHEENRLRATQLDEAREERLSRQQKEVKEQIGAKAGGGSGGYIVLDLPDSQRGLFQDLLKGFEEFSRLKGYGVSFSVDTTFKDHIAFKFTLTDPSVGVSNKRIRKDLTEYLERVASGHPIDDLPQVISIEEHDVLVATLKNRISFLQHSYNLAKTSSEFYEKLIQRTGNQPFLPTPNVVVQTGGLYSAPSYAALNSPQAVLGIGNDVTNKIRIAVTYKERKEQIDQLANVLEILSNEKPHPERDEAVRGLKNVKDELEHVDQPDPGRVRRWLESAKQAVQLGSLGQEAVQAAKDLFKLFF